MQTDTIELGKKVIIFDLDGTLAVSKQPLDEEMAELIRKLLHQQLVAVISGGFYPQFERQFLSSLHATEEEMKNILLLPTSGAVMYRYVNGHFEEIYSIEIEENERKSIIRNMNEAIDHFSLRPETPFGELVEDRRTQVTYSGLGQQAPSEIKEGWDPTREKRTLVVNFLKERLGDYNIRIGGTTSVDVTLPGIDKAYGIRKISEYLNIPINDMVFVGDALLDGGNDAPAKETGIDCVEVTGPHDTKEYIQKLLQD